MNKPFKTKKLDASRLWDYALRALGQRAHSAAEVRRKLAVRAEAPDAVAEVMRKLAEYGYLDDKKFAESFAAARLENQGFGRLRVIRDLQTKQVPRAVVDGAVSVAFAGIEEQALIERFLERKFRGKDLAEYLREEKHLASAYRRLRTAGFSANTSIRVLKRYASRAEELDGMEVDEQEDANH